MQTMRFTIISCAVGCWLIGCSTRQAELAQHRQAIVSARATAEMIREAWLAGRVAGPYAHVTLERALLLLEDDRRTLALSPELRNDSSGAAIAQDAEQLLQAIAQMSQAITDRDPARVRSLALSPPPRAGDS